MLVFLIIALLLSFPAPSYGHGFANFIQGTKGFAMGGAFTSIANDSSAVFYNPAGIHQLAENELMIGATNFFPARGEFLSSGTSNIPGTSTGQITETDSENHFLPYIYSTYKSTERFSLGFGIYTPFGQSTRWPEDWEGRFLPGGVESTIKSYRFEPVLSFDLNSRMTAGLGLFFQHVDIELQQKHWLPGEFHTKIEGKDLKPGFSAGLLIDVTDKLNFGISYKSRIEHDLNNMTVNFEPEFPLMGIVDAKADMEFATPSMVFSGLSYTVGKWTFAADIYWTEWSVQDKLIAHTDSSVFGDITLNKNWKDSLTYGFGFQYYWSETINIYGGYIIDNSPVPSDYLDPIVFHEDSQVLCFGFDYRYHFLNISMAFGHIKSSDQDFNNSIGDSPNPGNGRVTGTFVDCYQNVLTLSMSYMF